MSGIQAKRFDGIEVARACKLDCSPYFSSGTIFVGNTLINPNQKLHVYHLRKNNVPQVLKDNGVSDPEISHSIGGWLTYAVDNGFAVTIDELFVSIDDVVVIIDDVFIIIDDRGGFGAVGRPCRQLGWGQAAAQG